MIRFEKYDPRHLHYTSVSVCEIRSLGSVGESYCNSEPENITNYYEKQLKNK